MAPKWTDLTMLEQTARMNELKGAVNIKGRTFSDEDIYEILAIQNYLPTDKNVRLLIDGKVGIDALRNTREV